MKLFNKRAEAVGNQTMWLWSMFLILIAAGGIAAGVLIFYGYEYDSRTPEANILNNIISNCLSQEKINFSHEADFYSKCRLNRKVLLEEYNFTKINILICKEDCKDGEILFQLGSDFQSCNFKGKNEKYQRCIERFSKDVEGNTLQVIVGSNHLIRRVNT
ncbi:MAG: hypothetical protein Q8Q31_01355 [Nanoarchaeota archaeon]|nr:hypothetical protein [Nanoarchaeota archaeon]